MTTAQFLGGTPKPWMKGPHYAVEQTPNSASKLSPLTAQHSDTEQRSLSTQQHRQQETRNERTLPLQSSREAWTSHASPELSQATTMHNSTARRKSTGDGLNVDTVLPSPAPSDELRQDSSVVVDSVNEEDLATSRPDRSHVTRLNQLAERYGGIEALESRLRYSERVASPLPITPISQDPQDIHSNPNASRTQLPTNHNKSYENTRLKRRDGDSSTPRSLKRGSESDLSSNKRAHVASNLVHRGSEQAQSQSPTTLVHDSTLASNLADRDQPSPQQMHEFGRTITLRIQSVEADKRSRGEIEIPRLRLLQEACTTSDFYYLLLHQVYCLNCQLPEDQQQLSNIGFASEQLHGLAMLPQLLVPNSSMGASDDTAAWFSAFPRPLSVMLQSFKIYRIALGKLRSSLVKFALNWSQFRDTCHRRQYPPLVDDMTMHLGVDSPTLQRVIFTAIYRNIWNSQYDQCFREGEGLFRRDQYEARQRQALGTPTDSRANNQKLAMSYQSLWLKHVQHSQGHFQQRMNKNMARPMPPPQQGQLRPLMPTTHTVSASSQDPAGYAGSTGISVSTTQNSLLGEVGTSTLDLHSQAPGALPSSPSGYSPHATEINIHPQHFAAFPPPASPHVLRSNDGYGDHEQGRRLSSTNISPSTDRPPQQQFPSRPQPGRHFTDTGQLLGTQRQYPPVNVIEPISQDNFAQQRLLAQQVSNSSLLLPPPGQSIPTTAYPNPIMTALHQAHARSPILKMTTGYDGQETNTKYYRFIKGVAVLPNRLKLQVRHHIKWNFDIQQENFALLTGTVDGKNGAPPSRIVQLGSRFCRIKCIDASQLGNIISEAHWVVANHIWPPNITVLLNGRALEIRKKIHHGRDLPVDVTSLVKEGNNTLSVSTLRSQPNQKTVYAIGLETIQLTDAEAIKSDISKLGRISGQQRIMNRFGETDPDVQIVGSSVVLDLTDPYTSRIFDTPIRGRTCQHSQCFDLEIFLQTRSSKAPEQPCDPDSFKCPICGADARPQSLLQDDYMMALRDQLATMNRLDAKAIILHQDGKWDIKEQEETGEKGDGSGQRSVKGREASTTALERASLLRETEVIEIDDD
ncbi:MAG: hypothetical protein LQ342_000414 [Letrouitia transgressa]|nr:MAG: hypothetical protein LQ342_000414 [Letrouitia transgressa]